MSFGRYIAYGRYSGVAVKRGSTVLNFAQTALLIFFIVSPKYIIQRLCGDDLHPLLDVSEL